MLFWPHCSDFHHATTPHKLYYYYYYYNYCCLYIIQILKTLKILPIGNKTVLRDSRILSVVEKWSSEVLAASEHSTESVALADVTGDMDQEQEQEGSVTEMREGNIGAEMTESAGDKQHESVSQDDGEMHPSSVSDHHTAAFDLKRSL